MIHIEFITPERASELLKLNTSNRPVCEAHVKKLASAMTRGEWQFNGDSIRISKNSTLLDGQHRLLACIRSGITFKSLIISDIDLDVFQTIDSGRKRTGGDTLALMGYKNSANLAAALRVLVLFETGKLEQSFSVSNTMIKDALERFDGIEPCVTWVASHKDVRTLIQPSVCSAAFYLTRKMNKELADEFFSMIKTGENLRSGSPVLALRSVMIRQRMGTIKSKVNLKRDLLLILKAFSEYCAGNDVKSLIVGDVEASKLLVRFGGKP